MRQFRALSFMPTTRASRKQNAGGHRALLAAGDLPAKPMRQQPAR
jgi:hypothetical protein